MTRPPHVATSLAVAFACLSLLPSAAQAGNLPGLLQSPPGHIAQAPRWPQQGRPPVGPVPGVPVAQQATPLGLPVPVSSAGRVIHFGRHCAYQGYGCWQGRGFHHEAHFAGRGEPDWHLPHALPPAFVADPAITYMQPSAMIITINPAANSGLPDPAVTAAPPEATQQHGVRVIYLSDAPAAVWQRSDAPVHRHPRTGAGVLPVERPGVAKD